MSEFLDALSLRLKTPYLGYAILAFIAFNWRELFIFLFSTSTPQERVDLFDKTTSYYSLLLYPLLVGVVVAISTPWIRLIFSYLVRKPLELAVDMQLEEEHRKTIRQVELEQRRSSLFAIKEDELIGRAKRDDEVATIEDEAAKEKLISQLEGLRKERDELSEQLEQNKSASHPFDLNSEEQELLAAAAKNNRGIIVKPMSVGLRTIEAGGFTFGKNSKKEFGKYENALDKLVERRLVTDKERSGEIFHLTDLGWELASLV